MNPITNYTEASKNSSVKEGMDNFLANAEKKGYEILEGQSWKGAAIKMKLTCKEHGEFSMTPSNLSKGFSCSKRSELR